MMSDNTLSLFLSKIIMICHLITIISKYTEQSLTTTIQYCNNQRIANSESLDYKKHFFIKKYSCVKEKK